MLSPFAVGTPDVVLTGVRQWTNGAKDGRISLTVNSAKPRAWILVPLILVVLSAAIWAQTPPPKETFQQLSEQARGAQRGGQSEEAIRLYLKALEIRPEWADGWRNVGLLLADLKDYARAEIAFKNVLKTEPKDGTSWAMLGMVEFQEGRADDAYRDLQRGRALGIHNTDLENLATYHAAAIMIAKGEFEIAHTLLKRLASTQVDDPDVILAFGLAALRIPLMPEKLEESRRPLVARVGQIEYGSIHTPVPEVMAAYRELVEQYPRVPGVHYAFGNYLMDQAHYEEGLAEMQKVLELDPKNAMADLQIAMTCLKLSQPEKALPYAQEAARLRPDFFASRYALGWTFYRLGQNDRAIRELEMAVTLDPRNARTHFALSQAYMRAGRRADAERERAIFAKMKQAEPPTPGTASPREYTSSPDRNPPTSPQP